VALKNLEHVMKKEGYEVTTTLSGQNALKLLEEQQYEWCSRTSGWRRWTVSRSCSGPASCTRTAR